MEYTVFQTCMLFPGVSRGECASWFQAWGSIGAIAVAMFAVHWAHQLQAKQKARDAYDSYTQFLEVLFQLVGAAAQIAKKIYDCELDGHVTPDEYGSIRIELSAILDAMRKMPMERFDRYEFIEAWLASDACVRKLLASINQVGSPGYSKQLDPHYMRNVAHNMSLELQARAKKLLDGLNVRMSETGNSRA